MINLEFIARALYIYGTCARNDSLDLDGKCIADDMETFAHAVRNPDEYVLDSLLQQVGITTDKDNEYTWMVLNKRPSKTHDLEGILFRS